MTPSEAANSTIVAIEVVNRAQCATIDVIKQMAAEPVVDISDYREAREGLRTLNRVWVHLHERAANA